MQYGMTSHWTYGPALSALGYGAFYLSLAFLALRRYLHRTTAGYGGAGDRRRVCHACHSAGAFSALDGDGFGRWKGWVFFGWACNSSSGA